MCPTSYLIDFLPPLETAPKDTETPLPSASRISTWLPLDHFPVNDLVGRPRTTCAAYDMTYGDAAAFNTGMVYGNETGSFAYQVPAAQELMPAAFWTLDTAPAVDAEQKITYTVSDATDGTGYFDLVSVWTQCKNRKDDAQVVKKDLETEDIVINGVSYEVESYSWTLSVCAVGWFGVNCDQNMYAKTCRSIPATFSVTPQQISHVTVAPITSTLVSKTFLQSVDAFPGDCAPQNERVAVTLNLVIFDDAYTIKTAETVHDILSPAGILEGSQQDFDIISAAGAYTSFTKYLEDNSSPAEGVYVLDKRIVTAGSTSVYYQKVVIVTKCYKTDYNPAEGTRGSPSVFADAIAGANADPEHTLFDVEVILDKDGGNITNTLNLRVLATKETFVLPTTSVIKQKDATAYQALYGSYEKAKDDTAVNLPDKLAADTTMRGGDQVCSKHQLIEEDSKVVNLIPNAVGSCMLKKDLDTKWSTLIGTTIQYQVPGGQPTDYTYGCFPDWIDVSSVDKNSDGVYVFTGPVVRQSADEIHDSIFWFVQKEQLEETQEIGGELMKDRFGTALFWYDMNKNEIVNTRSDQFQTTLTDFNTNPSGCVIAAGAQKSACNLVCFDIVDGLLTAPNAVDARSILVHHVSVATIANETQTEGGDKLAPYATKHRRMLLESVSTASKSSESLPSGITTLEVMPGPKQGVVNVTNDEETIATRDIDGPKNFAPIFYPIMFVVIFASVGMLGCLQINKRYRQTYTGTMFNSNKASSDAKMSSIQSGMRERLIRQNDERDF